MAPHAVEAAEPQNYAQSGSPPEVGLELLQEEPHDLIYFTEKSGGGWVKARLLDLPDREFDENAAGILPIEIVGIDEDVFAARYRDIERIDFWEKRLQRETEERISRRDFTGAYPFLSVLIRDFPNLPGLRKIRSDFLWEDASDRALKGEYVQSLTMLDELRDYNPEYEPRRILRAIDALNGKLMEQMMQAGELENAQQTLARLKRKYGDSTLTSVKKWSDEFDRMATSKLQEANAAFAAQQYRQATKLARESVALSPNIEGGRDLVQKVRQTYPMVTVGVLRSAGDPDPTSIVNWGARRSGRLLFRTLFEMEDAGPEGGEYRFLFGDRDLSADRMDLDLILRPQKLEEPLNRITGYQVADVLLGRATGWHSAYFPPWASAVESIALDGPNLVRCRLRRPHILPACLLQVRVDGSWFGEAADSPTGDYRRLRESDQEVVYQLRDQPRAPEQPREIIEQHTRSAADGVRALLRGDIDVLDQLFPSDAARLKSNRDVRVVQYPLPTMHMLIPCSDHAYLAEPTFRRALVRGINRQDILRGELLEGFDVEGCQVVSGPFPAGIGPSDPLGYAYDQSIQPRRYEPSLAKLLMVMNETRLKAQAARADREPPEQTTLRLAHPPDNLSHTACEAIKSQWELLDLDVELVRLPVGKSFPDPGQADLVYASVAVWEPIIDARRLLGPEGLARSEDQYVNAGLRQLELARNWKEARDRLLDLHRTVNDALPVLPLWQMVESYAYRSDLTGMGRDIVTLYQNVDNWRLR